MQTEFAGNGLITGVDYNDGETVSLVAPFVKYSYRSDQVIHYKLIGGDHGLGVSGNTVYTTEAKQIIAAFLLQ